MRSSSRFFFLSLLGTACLSLYFSIQFLRNVWDYASLQGKTEARASRWEVEEVGERYEIGAQYSFSVGGKVWEGRAAFRDGLHLNEAAALEALKRRAKEPLFVWYDPTNPSFSSFEKSFPYGFLVKMGICLSVLIYFYCLRMKVSKIYIR